MNALSGSLLSLDVLADLTCDGRVKATAAKIRTVLADAFRTIGPASGARVILNAQVMPLLRTLGLDLSLGRDSATELLGTAGTSRGPSAHVAVGSWGADLG